MSEWWNLDQSLIWIVTRNLEQVELAEGDAEGIQERAHYYLGLAELGASETDDTADTGDSRDGLGPFKFLMKLLREGKIAAVKADDEIAALLPSSIFNGLEISPAETGAALVFRPPVTRLAASTGRAQKAALILLRRDDVMKWAPEKAHESLHAELAALASRAQDKAQGVAKEPRRQLSPERQRAREIVQEHHPNGMPRKQDGYGAQAKAIKAVKDQMAAEGWPKDKIKNLDETIRRAGGVKPG